MPCEWLKTDDGTVIHVNRGRGRPGPRFHSAPGGKKQICKFCGEKYSEGKLCDYPVGNGRTCDAAMCEKCARTLGRQNTTFGAGLTKLNDTIDVCPIHREKATVKEGVLIENHD